MTASYCLRVSVFMLDPGTVLHIFRRTKSFLRMSSQLVQARKLPAHYRVAVFGSISCVPLMHSSEDLQNLVYPPLRCCPVGYLRRKGSMVIRKTCVLEYKICLSSALYAFSSNPVFTLALIILMIKSQRNEVK